jgi:hypothetical protein
MVQSVTSDGFRFFLITVRKCKLQRVQDSALLGTNDGVAQ